MAERDGVDRYTESQGKLSAAIAIAADAFVGKYDKSGEPYILHCLEVMKNVSKWEDDDLRIAAVLHDVLEDTSISAGDLKGVYGFNDRVISTVLAVTFKKNCTDEEYMMQILKICENQDAIKVKMADLEHNSLILRMKGIDDKAMARTKKYHKAYYILKAHLLKK